MQKITYKNLIGWFSAFLIVVAYALLSYNITSADSIAYNTLNLVGGTGLAYRVWLDRNYSNFALEIIFILIAVKQLITIIL